MVIDHLGFGVSDYERAKAFYAEALAPLGITLVMEFGPEQTEGKVWACGFGKGGKPELWIGSDGKTTPPMHRDARRPIVGGTESGAGRHVLVQRACGRFDCAES